MRYLGAPLVLAVAFALVGCYTVLKHPVTSQEGPEYTDHPQEYYRQNCIDCHADYTEYPYGYFYGEYPELYFEYPRWGYYYAYPWWWDHYWYNDVDGDEIIGTSSAKAGRRGGGLLPPYSVGAPAVNTGSNVGGGYRGSGAVTPPTKGNTTAREAGTAVRDGRVKTRVIVPADADTTQSQDGTQSKDQKKATRRGGSPPR